MDENNNVLTGDIAALRQFRDVVDRNINSTNQVENLKNEEKRLDKEINSNKRAEEMLSLPSTIPRLVKKRIVLRKLKISGQRPKKRALRNE